jgi:hypothetical protein
VARQLRVCVSAALSCRHGHSRRRAHRAEFDREYKRALVTAAETMELAGVHALVEQWRRRAWVTNDLEVYQRMMDRIDRLRRGEDVSSVPVEEVRAVIRERLGL